MSLRSFKSTEVRDMNGAWLRYKSQVDVPPDQALSSLNMEYPAPGETNTRFGFGQAFNPNEPISGMFNWVKGSDAVSAKGNYLIYSNPSNGNVRLVSSLSSPSPTTLFTQTGTQGISVAQNGTRVYIASYNSSGNASGHCHVTGIYGAAVQTDRAFLAPLQIKPVLGTGGPGSGNCTAGTKRVGYILQTRNGFLGSLSPVTTAGVFDITSTVVAQAGQSITFSVTATNASAPFTWPAETAFIFPFLTTSTNLNRYYLEPTIEAAGGIAISPGSTFTYTASLSISDADLTSAATEVTSHLNLFTQDQSGNGPFDPFVVLEYGSRMVYLTSINGIYQAFASDPGIPQQLQAAFNVITLPGFKQMTSAFTLYDTLYITGPHWTYYTRDNGSSPATWAIAPVDGGIGAMGPLATAVNPSLGLGWVAHESGLYLFAGGAYQQRPVSYNVEPDWKRINLSAAATVQVVDNRDKQQVYVLVPLDGATSPSHIMMFDYSMGFMPEAIKYSLWNLAGVTTPGAIEVVQNDTTKHLELWVANQTAGLMYRQMNDHDDASPYLDNTSAIPWSYQLALQPGLFDQLGQVWAHHAVQFRAFGAGTLNINALAMDAAQTIALPSYTFGSGAGMEHTLRFRLNNEGCSYQFSGTGTPSWARLGQLRHFYTPWIGFRE